MTFNNKTIEELHNLLVSKEISATELTQATLEDIKSREEAINAFVTIAEDQALAQAKAIDETGIDADNVLSGIPLAVKDNISTDGLLTTAASKMLYNYEPIFDATAVANAKSKGMIVVGKTNMDEFAMGGSGETSYYGATKNAWDHSKVKTYPLFRPKQVLEKPMVTCYQPYRLKMKGESCSVFRLKFFKIR